MNDTIAAISTAPGAAAIGVARLSGPNAVAVTERLFRPCVGKSLSAMKGYTAALGRVFDSEGDLDDAVATLYQAPKSYTGEDVVELSCHGGSFILQRVLDLCIANGARPANPGEFTQRAFLSGKMGLDQAEAVMSIISAQGDSALRAALAARDGALSTAIRSIVENLLQQAAHLSAWADYPEEDIEEVDAAALAATLLHEKTAIDSLLATWDTGRLLRDGIATVIAGKPNVGKSTLMNLLAGCARSIVTDMPGTTRDVVEEPTRLGGYVLRLLDTAGLRAARDEAERIGVERAQQRIETADLVLAVFDASSALDEQDEAFLPLLAGRPCIAVLNKCDLPRQADTARIEAAFPRVVALSAKTGEGRQALEEQILNALSLSNLDPSAPVLLAGRQRRCLMQARDALCEALDALAQQATLDAVGVCVDEALEALLSLTGERVSDAVVHEVFSRFCVGK